jgi:hypothetical protein
MSLADQKLDTMPFGTAASIFGIDDTGKPVLARAFQFGTVNAGEEVEFGAIPGNGFGVPYFRPKASNNLGVLDVMPNGNPANVAGYGKAWFDVCLQDISAGPVPVQCAHLAMRTDFAEISMRAFNSSTKLPIVFGVGDDTDVTECLRSNIDGTLQLGSANIKANGSVATVLGSLGPVGSRTTVQKWFQIKDASGNPFFLAAF